MRGQAVRKTGIWGLLRTLTPHSSIFKQSAIKINKMGLFEDLHLLICIIALIYLFRKVKAATESRVLGVVVAAFIVFFIFYQHVWVAFLFFFVMFGYLFVGGFTAGIVEGQMAQAYMGFLKHPPSGGMMYPMPSPSGGTGSWFGPSSFK